jgi:hypothetical protein
MIVSLPNPDGKFFVPDQVSRFLPSFPAAAINSHGKFLIASYVRKSKSFFDAI